VQQRKTNGAVNNGKHLATQQSLNGAIKSICDIMRHSNCAGALQYVPELTWILFLRILSETVDPTHVFTLSQIYEGPLLKMGEKGNDGGQFFTAREIIRVMVKVIDPMIGEKVYDPDCGTGGFLAQAYEHMTAFVQTKRKLLDTCHLWCILCFTPGTFVNASAGVKINLLFYTKGKPTEIIWYYELSGIGVGKTSPFTLTHFEEFFRLLPERADSERSWTVTRPQIEAKNYDLKAVNPHATDDEDTRTPEELLPLIESKGREVAQALAALRVGRRSL
jgi:type I restriction-modification system DNA methylase subunit